MCLFKYLVSEEDPQKGYSICILIVNSICMILISVSYLNVMMRATQSRRKSVAIKSAACKKRDMRMQVKISAIILTDLIAWLPFIVVCFLHFGNIIDATSWYPIFSVVLIPINSVINPLLYGAETFKTFITNPIKRVQTIVRSSRPSRMEIGAERTDVSFVSRPSVGAPLAGGAARPIRRGVVAVTATGYMRKGSSGKQPQPAVSTRRTTPSDRLSVQGRGPRPSRTLQHQISRDCTKMEDSD